MNLISFVIFESQKQLLNTYPPTRTLSRPIKRSNEDKSLIRIAKEKRWPDIVKLCVSSLLFLLCSSMVNKQEMIIYKEKKKVSSLMETRVRTETTDRNRENVRFSRGG